MNKTNNLLDSMNIKPTPYDGNVDYDIKPM